MILALVGAHLSPATRLLPFTLCPGSRLGQVDSLLTSPIGPTYREAHRAKGQWERSDTFSHPDCPRTWELMKVKASENYEKGGRQPNSCVPCDVLLRCGSSDEGLPSANSILFIPQCTSSGKSLRKQPSLTWVIVYRS